MDVSQLEHFRTSGILDAEGAAEDPSQDLSQDMMMVNVFKWLYTSGNSFDPQVLLPRLYKCCLPILLTKARATPQITSQMSRRGSWDT